jgi:predicted PurR-regulated permease PerM
LILAGPRLGQQMTDQLSNQLNKVYRVVQPLFGGDLDLELFVQNRAQGLITPLLGKTTDVLGGILSGISYIALVPLISFFFLREGNRIAHAIVELVPNPYFELSLNLLHHINAQIGGYIRGQILATSIVACLAVIGLSIVGLRFPLVVGVVAGLANMIPYLGPYNWPWCRLDCLLGNLGGMEYGRPGCHRLFICATYR